MASGDIGPVLGTGIFDVATGNEPSIVHVSGNVYAIAYRGSGNDGWLITLTISGDGTTIALTGSSLEFDGASGYGPHIIHVSGDVYAIAYWNATSNDGIVKTVSIDSAGNIGSINSFTFDAVKGWVPDIIHIFDDVYAIAYRGPDDDGWLITLTISADGTAIALTGKSLEFDSAYCDKPRITHISGDVYAINYEPYATGGGQVHTMIIDNVGNIGAGVIHTLLYRTGPSQYNTRIIRVSGDVYAVAWRDIGDIGYICTFTIDNLGHMPATIIGGIPGGYYEFEGDEASYNDLIHIGGNVFAIAYTGPAGGSLKTLTISGDGTTIALTGSFLQFDTGVDIYPQLIHVGDDVYAVVYNHAPGTVKTMAIEAIILSSVTTDPATSVAGISATLNGTLDDDGGEACDCGFEYGETIAYGNTTPTQSKETGESFLQAISGLSPGVTYHFRALATNSQGTSNGSDRTFTTTLVAPSVTTNPATEVSILNGTLDDDGGEACDCGFEWGETIAYGNTTSTQSKETGETFAHLLGELSPATTYHFRAFATNSQGTSYGSDQSFTTPVGLPTVTTEAASAIGLNGATLNGALTSDGGEPCYCGFEWGATIAYGSTTPTQRKVTGEVFSQPLLNLGEAAQYHFRAFATNSAGTAYGEDRTIDTLFRINKAYALGRYEI